MGHPGQRLAGRFDIEHSVFALRTPFEGVSSPSDRTNV